MVKHSWRNVTSNKGYENREWPWGYWENDPLGGHDPYSNSKACAELVTSGFCDSYFHRVGSGRVRIAVASGRAGNVIGGGDWTRDQLIPDLVRSFLDNKPCSYKGDLSNVKRCSAINRWRVPMA